MGDKIYQVCDVVTGYCCNFKIEAGESTNVCSLVLVLMSDYRGQGCELYVDRYYTSTRQLRCFVTFGSNALWQLAHA